MTSLAPYVECAMSKQQVEIIVVNEHTIGYRDPGSNTYQVLHASILKGANWSSPMSDGGLKFLDELDSVRLANSHDFKEFRICEDGYRENAGTIEYIYDRDGGPQLFDIIFQNDYHGQYSVSATVDSLEKAREARQVSGDIVVYHGTTKLVRNYGWFFDHENGDPDCYAARRMRMKDVEGRKFGRQYWINKRDSDPSIGDTITCAVSILMNPWGKGELVSTNRKVSAKVVDKCEVSGTLLVEPTVPLKRISDDVDQILL